MTRLLALLLCLAGTPGAAAAQATGWRAAATYAWELPASEDPIWADWHRVSIGAHHRWSAGSAGVELVHVERFREVDRAVTVNGYRRLWRGAYTNVRAQLAADADVLPPTDAAVELFQSVARVWELSATTRYMAYEPDVHIHSAALARYVGPWMLRARGSWIPREHGDGTVATLSARRFFSDDPEAYLDALVGRGEEWTLLGAGPLTDLRSSRFGVVRGQRWLTPLLGGQLGFTYTRHEGVPSRFGVLTGVTARF